MLPLEINAASNGVDMPIDIERDELFLDPPGPRGASRRGKSRRLRWSLEPAESSDPVRTYLREMGTVRLLKREDEVFLAKQIERGDALVLKAIARSPIAIEALIAAAEDIRRGSRPINEIVYFPNEGLRRIQAPKPAGRTLETIDKLAGGSRPTGEQASGQSGADSQIQDQVSCTGKMATRTDARAHLSVGSVY